LKKEAEEHYRTRFALALKDKDPLEIIRQITFDGVAPAIVIGDIEKLFDFVEKDLLGKKIAGVGLEVGGGPGTFSSILARRQSVKKMYDVEICRPIVEELLPRVSSHVLNGLTDKIVGAVGSFDDIKLPDNSIDFIFDYFSLHHSDNISITFKECHRVLKSGGFIFCFDKARPDYYTDADLTGLIDAEYGREFKKQFGLPLDQEWTRRMNGEKEYRLTDWRGAFLRAGFGKFESFYLAKIGGGRISLAVKNILSNMPVSLQFMLARFMPKPRFNHKFILDPKNRIFTKLLNNFPKEVSIMIAHKI